MRKEEKRKGYIEKSISVDASCIGNPGKMEYRVMETDTGKVLYSSKVYEWGTNNIGEFLAIVEALKIMKGSGRRRVIYSDSKTGISWVKKKKIGTTLEKSDRTCEVYEAIRRAMWWLRANKYENKVIKWRTKEWGEIRADYGRKACSKREW